MTRSVLHKLKDPGASDIPKSLEPFVGKGYDLGLIDEQTEGNTKIN